MREVIYRVKTKEKTILNCNNCKNEIKNEKSKKYCHEFRPHNCIVCKADFNLKCEGKKLRKTCSKTCSSKLVPTNIAKKNIRNCERCGVKFNRKSSTSKYCNRDIEVDCKGCENTFERKCNNGKGSYCSHSCRNRATRRNKYKISEIRTCDICYDEFESTTSRQRFCFKDHYKNCLFCEDSFIVSKTRWGRTNSNKYCDNICSTLAQGDSKLDKNLVKEYKNPNEWALNFKKKNKRKPKKAEFLMHFGLRVPKFADTKLFEKSRDSKLELTVIYYLKSLGLEEDKDFLRRSRFKVDDRWFEVDIYFPKSKIGLEVQDFDTHTRGESGKLDKYGKPIKDSRYHEMKPSALDGLGITVYEIWEDEITTGSFRKTVRETLRLY